MAISDLGNAFYELRLDAPHTRADLRFHQAGKGLNTSAEIMNAGEGATFARQVVATIDPSNDPFTLVVALYASVDEMASLSAESRLVRWAPTSAAWRQAGTKEIEIGFYPARPTQDDVGRQGIDVDRGVIWAIVDVAGIFTIGRPGETLPPVSLTETPGTTPGPVTVPGATMCGMSGAGLAMTLILMIATGRRRRQSQSIV